VNFGAVNRCSPVMAESVYSSYPPVLDRAQEQSLVSAIKEWAIQNGLTIRIPASEGVDGIQFSTTTAPVTLFPSLFPKSCFDEARSLQTVYNELYAAISSNEAWLGDIMEE
jgi:glutathione synthase